MLFGILFLILLDKWKQVDRSNSEENDIAILNFVKLFVFLNNATFSNLEGLEVVLSSNLYFLFSLSLECNDTEVVQVLVELDMIYISSMRKTSLLIEGLAPLFLLVVTRAVVQTTVFFTEHLSPSKYLAWRHKQFIQGKWVIVLKVVIKCSVVELCRHVILNKVYCLFDHIRRWSHKGVDFAMITLSQLQENDRSLADDLVDHQSTHYDEEYGTKSQYKMEFPPENIVEGMLYEKFGDLVQILCLKVFRLHELLL